MDPYGVDGDCAVDHRRKLDRLLGHAKPAQLERGHHHVHACDGDRQLSAGGLVCAEVPAEGTVDLVAFHAEQGRHYIGAYAVSVLFALCANVVYDSAFNLLGWSEHDLVVIPMLLISVPAAFFLSRRFQIFALACLAVLWGTCFLELQQALR